MCGIVGIISDKPITELKTSLNDIAHRGPDDSGTFFSNGIALGHQRLSIQDLSQNGHQPMFSEDKRFVIVFNGEIYNHWELRQGLRDKYLFKSNSDTETILYCYIEYGTEFLNKLIGIFAFCIYDTESHDILVARDQFGVKPLYYTLNETTFSFSSELKSIVKIFDSKSVINHEALFNYLYFLWSPGENTPYDNFKKLMPGHFIKGNSKDLHSLKIVKYYEIPFTGERLIISESELIKQLEIRLIKAVERQLLSDVPVGFFLSGGLDSSLIVAIAKLIKPDSKFTCFTIDTSFKSKIDDFSSDLPFAKLVASFLDLNLEIVKSDINILNDFDKLIWHLDEPQADPAPLNVLNICRRAKEMGYSVLLGGSGGDDLFSGYRRHQQLYYNKKIKHIPLFIKRFFYRLFVLVPINHHKIRRIRKFLSFFKGHSKEDRFVSQFGWLDKNEILNLFSKEFREKLENYNPNNIFIDTLKYISTNEDDLNKMLFLEMKFFLADHNLNYTDKLSMAVGVEVRVPFLDKELVEFSTLIPTEYKMKGVTTKYILKKVAEKYLPHEVIYRSKSGFGAPVRDWIINDLSDFIDVRLSKEKVDARGIFDFNSIQKLIRSNKNNSIDASYTIWALLSIESWLDQFYNN